MLNDGILCKHFATAHKERPNKPTQLASQLTRLYCWHKTFKSRQNQPIACQSEDLFESVLTEKYG
jgi:hypothetical protein